MAICVLLHCAIKRIHLLLSGSNLQQTSSRCSCESQSFRWHIATYLRYSTLVVEVSEDGHDNEDDDNDESVCTTMTIAGVHDTSGANAATGRRVNHAHPARPPNAPRNSVSQKQALLRLVAL